MCTDRQDGTTLILSHVLCENDADRVFQTNLKADERRVLLLRTVDDNMVGGLLLTIGRKRNSNDEGNEEKNGSRF